jgi:hypothetical protein
MPWPDTTHISIKYFVQGASLVYHSITLPPPESFQLRFIIIIIYYSLCLTNTGCTDDQEMKGSGSESESDGIESTSTNLFLGMITPLD